MFLRTVGGRNKEAFLRGRLIILLKSLGVNMRKEENWIMNKTGGALGKGHLEESDYVLACRMSRLCFIFYQSLVIPNSSGGHISFNQGIFEKWSNQILGASDSV